MNTHPSVETYTHYLQAPDQWETLLARFPADLEQTVFTSGAILRPREVRMATQLLRLIFAYACNVPLTVVVGWATALGLATLSDEALRKRIRHARAWLQHLLAQVLAARAGMTTSLPLRLRLTDGTQVTGPGAAGTQWRLHLTFDLHRMRLDAAVLTDAHGSESLAHSLPQPGDVVVGDRNYGTRAGVLALVHAQAHALVRLTWSNFPLRALTGEPFVLLDALRSVAAEATAVWNVQMRPLRKTDPVVTGRLIITRLPAVQEAAARARVRKHHAKTAKKTKDGHPARLHPATLEAAGCLILFTTIPTALASAAQVVALYRLRWQIELAFKRLKSVLGLAHLTARHPELCRAVLYAKLLLAVLVEDLCADAEAVSPSARPRRSTHPAPQLVEPVPTGVGNRAGHHSHTATPRPMDPTVPRLSRLLHRCAAQTPETSRLGATGAG